MGVAKILRSHRIPPAPRRSQTTWRQFVRRHAAQMLATDFFTFETAWLQRLHVLFFIEIASRAIVIPSRVIELTQAGVRHTSSRTGYLSSGARLTSSLGS